MTVDDMVARASNSGYRDAESEPARFLLGRVSYQHISGYFPLLEDPEHDRIRNLRTIHLMMQMDRSYQLILLEAIGLFELQLRSRYSREMSLKFGPFAHRNHRLFKNERYYRDFLSRYAAVLANASRRNGSRAQRDIRRYGDMPIWEAVEEMPIGMISKLYANTRNPKVREAVANSFGVESGLLENWMRAISVVRNRCAHFGQLLGEKLAIMPRKMPEIPADNESPFFIALMLMRLLRTNNYFGDITLLPSVMTGTRLHQLFIGDAITARLLQVPENWEELLCSKSLTGVRLEINGRDLRDPGKKKLGLKMD